MTTTTGFPTDIHDLDGWRALIGSIVNISTASGTTDGELLDAQSIQTLDSEGEAYDAILVAAPDTEWRGIWIPVSIIDIKDSWIGQRSWRSERTMDASPNVRRPTCPDCGSHLDEDPALPGSLYRRCRSPRCGVIAVLVFDDDLPKSEAVR